jgi:OOP family OmpA-OmpF porin
MKKLLLLLLACLIVYSFSTTAYSAEGPYVSVNIGAAMASDSDLTESGEPIASLESSTGFAGGIALGYGFSDNIRIEGELAYQKNDIDKYTEPGDSSNASGDTSSLALLLNGYYDFANSSAFTPFISVGIGAAKVEVNDFNVEGSGEPSDSEDDTVFAYQVGLGVGYAVSEKTSIDLKYRYFGTADPDFDGVESEYESHNFYVGLRFGF